MQPLAAQLIARAQFWAQFGRQPTTGELRSFCQQSPYVPISELFSDAGDDPNDLTVTNENRVNEAQEQMSLSV